MLLARAAGIGADGEFFQQHRITRFQNLRIGEARIGHMRVHRRHAVEIASRARAAADGFIILMARIAEGEIVHRALARGEHAQASEQRIHHRLARLHIARGHGGGRIGIEQRAAGHHDLDRLEATGIHRNVAFDKATEDIKHRRLGHRSRRVEIVVLLRRGAGEIHARRTRRAIHADLHPDRHAAIHRHGKFAVFQRADHLAHAFLGIVLHMAHIGGDDVRAVIGASAPQLRNAAGATCRLRFQVRDVLRRIARGIGAAFQHTHHRGVVEMAGLHHRHAVEQHALFGNVAREGRHGAGRRAADIGVMAAARHIETCCAIHEHRCHHRDVRQMRAAVIGRIGDEHVVFAHGLVLLHDRGDAIAHRSQVHRHMRRIRHQPAIGIEDRAGEIQPLLDVHRGGGVLQRRAHFLGDGHEEIGEHFQRDGIGVGGRIDRGLRGGVARQH